jgi:Leucine-rich repeat (LRR) protein
MSSSRRPKSPTERSENVFRCTPDLLVNKSLTTGKSQETKKRRNTSTPFASSSSTLPRNRPNAELPRQPERAESTDLQPFMAPNRSRNHHHHRADTISMQQAPPTIPKKRDTSRHLCTESNNATLQLREQVVSQTVFAADQQLKTDLRRREQQEQPELCVVMRASRIRAKKGVEGSSRIRSRPSNTSVTRNKRTKIAASRNNNHDDDNNNSQTLAYESPLTDESFNSTHQRREQVVEQTVFANSNKEEHPAPVKADRRLNASGRREETKKYADMHATKAPSQQSTPEVFHDEPSDDDKTPLPPPQPTRQSNISLLVIQPGAYEGLPGEGFRRIRSDWKRDFRTHPSEAALPAYNRPPVARATDDTGEDADELARALPVEDEDLGFASFRGVARPVALYQQERKRRRLLWLISVLLVLGGLLLVALILGLIVRSQRPNGASRSPNTTPPPGMITMSPTALVIEGLPKWTLSPIQNDPGSPQAQAYQWIIKDPNRDVFPNGRRLQRFALANLFFATKGYNWTNNEHWLDYNITECQWFHGTHNTDLEDPPAILLNQCDGSGDVLRLNLSSNNLQGNIPPEIGLLTTLAELHLENNQIQGSLPSQIGLLRKLDGMYVNNNTLGGSLPSELGMLSFIGNLHIFGSRLEGNLPTEIGLLSALTQLHIQNTEIGGQLPTQLGDLVRLEEFLAWNTKFTGTLPSHMGRMVSLKSLAMHNGELVGKIPTTFGLLSNLVMIQIDANRLSGSIPSEFGRLTNTKLLSFGDNQLSSTIPTELGLLSTALGALRFYQNELVGNIPTQLGWLGLVQRLELDGNKLSHTIPTHLGTMSYLQHLFLASNQFTGGLPSELGALPFLREITLQNNQRLISSIPQEWGDMASLAELFLSGVDITGLIPSQLCALDRIAVDCDSNVCGCDCGLC